MQKAIKIRLYKLLTFPILLLQPLGCTADGTLPAELHLYKTQSRPLVFTTTYN